MTLLKSGFSVGIRTLISRILGLARELMMANYFGTTIYADALNTALKLPNLFRRLLAEGAFSSVFVPRYSDKMNKEKSDASSFAGEIFLFLIIITSLIVIIFIFFMPQILMFLAPGFYLIPEKFHLTVLMCRITMPYLTIIAVTAFFGAISNSHGIFSPFAIAPAILNLFLIIWIYITRDTISQATLISFGLIISGLIQLFYVLYSLFENKIFINFSSKKFFTERSKSFLKALVPAVGSQGVTQINLFISHSISSFFPSVVSILAYADRIYQLPLSLIGICFGTILLPKLSELYSKKDFETAISIQTDSIKFGIFLSLPATVGILSLSYDIIHVLYERNAFTTEDTVKTSQALLFFTFGLPAFVLSKILTPIFYSKHDVKTPFKISVITIISNIILNICLVFYLEHIGIALATSISSWINVFLLIKYIKADSKTIINQNIFYFILKIIFSSFLMYVTIFSSKILISKYYPDPSMILKILFLVFFVMLGAVVYFLFCYIIGVFRIKSNMRPTW